MLGNLLRLSFFQVIGFIIPLIILPHLVLTLKAQGFGIYSVFQNFLLIGTVVSDFGYAVNGFKEASLNYDNEVYIKNYVAVTIVLRLAISLLFLIICLPLFFRLMPSSVSHQAFLVLSISILLNASTFNWYFQGIGKPNIVAFIGILAKCFTLLATILFIHSPSGVNLSIIFCIFPYLFSFAYSVGFSDILNAEKLRNVQVKDVVGHYRDGMQYFLPSLLSIIFTSSGVLILSYFKGNAIAGDYSAIEKIIKAVASINGPIYQVSFPGVALAYSKSKEAGDLLIKRHFVTFLIMFLAAFFFMEALGDKIISLLYNKKYVIYYDIIRTLSFYIPLSGINTFIGIIYLSANNLQLIYARAFAFATCLSLIIFLLFSPFFSYHASAVGLVVGELALSLFIVISLFLRRRHEN